MADVGQNVCPVGVEMPLERELVPGGELPAGALARDRERTCGLLLNPDGGRAIVVLEDVLDVAGPVAAPRADPVKALGVAAGEVVKLQLAVPRDLESVADGSHLHRGEHGFDGLEVLARQLEALVPERVLARPDLLPLLPGMNTVFFAQSPFDHFVNGGRRAWHIGVAHGRVGDDHLVAAVGMGEEVIDPLFLHEPAGEVEVGLAVLDAVVTWFVGPQELVVDAQAGEDLLEDVGHGDLLEDPALGLPGQQPELGDDLRLVAGEERSPHG